MNAENPHAVHEIHLHSLKHGVWCIISTQRRKRTREDII